MLKKKIVSTLVLLVLALNAWTADGKVVVAYVTSWSDIMPDPSCMTHINYAFGHVGSDFRSVTIDNPERLKSIVNLKSKNPQLRILLSIGGWGSGRFSEMASNDENRKDFVHDCQRMVDTYSLDGIDIDWEYPTSNAAGISASPADINNFSLLISDLRLALGKTKLLTLATIASAEYIDFPAILPYIDFVNVMSYDMASPPKHHSPLFVSENSSWMTADRAVNAHIRAGVPADKIVMGMPFYGRGIKEYRDFQDYKNISAAGGRYVEKWDNTAKVPYLVDTAGNFVCGYDNPRSLALKCQYIIDNGLRGGMYWDYAGDNDLGNLRHTVKEQLLDNTIPDYVARYAREPRFHALFVYDPHAEPAHVEFDKQALDFFHRLSYGEGFLYDVAESLSEYTLEKIQQYDIIVMLNAIPAPDEREVFRKYMESGGGWLGFHASAFNDKATNWPWFNDFIGCGTFLCNNWPPQPALVLCDTNNHPVTKNLPERFVAPASEFYQWQPSPRLNPDVKILVSISSDNYPFGLKDIVLHGDFPIVWSNTRYRMVYLNMGHGDKGFSDATQNLLIVNAFRFVVSQNPKGDPFAK